MQKNISVIDLFSGPGGLSEGFSQFDNGETFNPFVSVEMDINACNTLKIRKLFHFLKNTKHPKLKTYYRYLKSQKSISWDCIKTEFSDVEKIIDNAVWRHELGSWPTDDTCNEIRRRLKTLGHRKENEIVLIGGPPCQAYSLIGRSKRSQQQEKGTYSPEEDHRNYLYEWYLNILPEFKPAVFIMENVPGILSSKINGEYIFDKIINDLQSPKTKNGRVVKYKLFPLVEPEQEDLFQKGRATDFRIKSERYGVGQSRKRVIILGVRENFSDIDHIPYLADMNKLICASDVINDLPKLRSGISKIDRKKVTDSCSLWKEQLDKGWLSLTRGASREIRGEINRVRKIIKKENYLDDRGDFYVPCLKYGKKKKSQLPKDLFSWYVDKKLDGYLNHESRSHMDTDLKRYLFNIIYSDIKGKSPLLTDYPERLLPEHKNTKSGNHKDRFRTVLQNLPGKTITSHISKDGHAYIHYDPKQCRSLTVREAARIQSFPDNYYFCGNRTQQYHQVGNAVPPYLAFQIADIVNYIIIEA